MALFRPFFQKFSIVFLCLFRSAISKWQRTIAASGRVASRTTRPSGKSAPTRRPLPPRPTRLREARSARSCASHVGPASSHYRTLTPVFLFLPHHVRHGVHTHGSG